MSNFLNVSPFVREKRQFLSDSFSLTKGLRTLETLDFTIRLGSTDKTYSSLLTLLNVRDTQPKCDFYLSSQHFLNYLNLIIHCFAFSCNLQGHHNYNQL